MPADKKGGRRPPLGSGRASPYDRPPVFSKAFQAQFDTLLHWRRDVRRFLRTPLPEGLVEELLSQAHMSPSVGNSQPWRFVLVESEERRRAVRESFLRANAKALASYDGERAAAYARLKLAGLDDAPVHIAVFCDEATGQGFGLGRHTMPEMLAYSVVCAISTLWLAARTRGIGLGWVSILEPEVVTEALQVERGWRLIAYLCLGYPQEEHSDPELERAHWQSRGDVLDRILKR
ncbi:5,6-dimethylbenzimidazole synthase [Stappia sp. F7233]|uniref:5,6-dimethylbenzimidazole synthase n=1 Tax=Stappia albiluteola TaxID=2758565 RepID=A0A839A9K6_9HYPH|nr:5,6-dimethylbenzimidazole synthase [Stappia albiluteola]MBA5775738.1 5,6-dimethylbenzimidazole synthase [Stappia albiluteola]